MKSLSAILLAAFASASFGQGLTAQQIIDDIKLSSGKDRYSAFEELAKLGLSALPIVRQMMHDSDESIAWNAPFLAVDMHTKEVLPLLLQRLRSEKDGTGLSVLILTIGNHGNPNAIPALLPYLKNPNAYIRSNTCYALGRLGDLKTIPALRPLVNDSSDSVRVCAHKAIADIKSIDAKYPGRLSNPNAWWLRSAPPAPETYPYKDRQARDRELRLYQSQIGAGNATQWTGGRQEGD